MEPEPANSAASEFSWLQILIFEKAKVPGSFILLFISSFPLSLSPSLLPPSLLPFFLHPSLLLPFIHAGSKYCQHQGHEGKCFLSIFLFIISSDPDVHSKKCEVSPSFFFFFFSLPPWLEVGYQFPDQRLNPDHGSESTMS